MPGEKKKMFKSYVGDSSSYEGDNSPTWEIISPT